MPDRKNLSLHSDLQRARTEREAICCWGKFYNSVTDCQGMKNTPIVPCSDIWPVGLLQSLRSTLGCVRRMVNEVALIFYQRLLSHSNRNNFSSATATASAPGRMKHVHRATSRKKYCTPTALRGVFTRREVERLEARRKRHIMTQSPRSKHHKHLPKCFQTTQYSTALLRTQSCLGW